MIVCPNCDDALMYNVRIPIIKGEHKPLFNVLKCYICGHICIEPEVVKYV